MQGHQPGHRSDTHTRVGASHVDVGSLTLCRLRPAGHPFDLSALTKLGGYTVYDHVDPRKMFRMNVCGTLPDAKCGPDAGACRPISDLGPLMPLNSVPLISISAPRLSSGINDSFNQ